MVEYIKKMFKKSFKKEWYKTYWAIDVHGVILMPYHEQQPLNHPQWYPYAKESLQILSKRGDIVLILSTSSYPEQIEKYLKIFERNNVLFDYINENPEIDSLKGNFGYYKNKYYFDVMLEDKAGFDANKEWKLIYDYLKFCNDTGYLPNPKWTTKY